MLRKLKWQNPGEPLAARYNWCQGPAVEKHWSVALVTQHTKRMRGVILSSVACPAVPCFATLSHKQHDVREKSLNTKCGFWFSLQCLSEIFISIRRIERHLIKNVYWCSGELVFRWFGVKANWCSGELVFMWIGVQVIWCSGDLLFKFYWCSSFIGVQVYWCSGVLVFRWICVQVIWCSGDLVFRWFGVQVIWCSGDLVFGWFGVQVNWCSC